eukprot:TRINITY_DN1612_c0_g1_i2.p1 TRINITY_DN1612_c0_g1~~TRINITY_DN1612_c0_g1_i2.p1  ORF type:complete len:508 (+),score=215.78 TRINITY_DN1612_c0_g1_i2:125-1525(+)
MDAKFDAVKGFLEFVNASPSPFHAVAEATRMLEQNGFRKISEKNDEDWKVERGGKYYFTRNQSTIFAFAVGGRFAPGNGFTISASHTDSPVLRVKPRSNVKKEGFLQVGVECYGGGLWHTWFDRDLSIAGRAIVANEDNSKFESRLVRINRPVLSIPNLAIHLNRSVNDEGFKLNKETHLVPILATVQAQLDANIALPSESSESKQATTLSKHHPLLMHLLSQELQVDASFIRDFELSLYDTQPATVTGALNEFVCSARLDNLLMSYVSLISLIHSLDDASFQTDPNIRLVALFDHEECGSESAQGAASTLMQSVIARLSGQSVDTSIRRSFLLSCDMAHAVHPNYRDKHEDLNRPAMHGGLVVKENSNQRYATNSLSAFIINELARRHQIGVQDFCVRNDAMCGSTVGPILAANTGLRTVDVGVPQFAMHSIRETCATSDIVSSHKLVTAFFNEFPALDESVTMD